MKRRLIRKVIKAVLNNPLRYFGYEIRSIPLAEKNKYVWLKNLGINTVIDIGANEGQFAKQMFELLPQVNIYSFEPLQECYSKMSQLCNEHKRLKVFPYACGDKDDTAEMYRSEFSPSSSILKMADKHKVLFPHSSKITRETIIVKRLDDVANTLTIDKKLLIKIDVQGFEDRVIKGGKKTIDQASVILTEVSFDTLYEGQADFHTVYNLLSQMGFRFTGLLDQISETLTGLPVQGDAVFMRAHGR